ncbi:MAG TPA: zinc ABC transporter substrate-binding protein [Aldersonia sp.]
MNGRLRVAVLGALATSVLVLGGCSSDGGDGRGGAGGGRPEVVASTNVWGSVVSAVAGPDADVTSIVTDPAADPHSYESSPADAAAVIDADLVVFNGGGYDEFVEKILAGDPGKPTVEAVALLPDSASDPSTDPASDPASESAPESAERDEHSHGDGHDHGHDHGSVNEHVWYDVATAGAVADRVATELGTLDPANADGYRERAATFRAQLGAINAITTRIATEHPGARVVQTEPIAHYLLLRAGLTDVTPPEFSNGVENETDPPPAAIAATRDLLTSHTVRALVWNTQTQDRVTEDMRAVATGAGVPVVEVTETLPAGDDYIAWLTANATSLETALAQ